MACALQNMQNWQKTIRTLSESATFLFDNNIMSDVEFVFNNDVDNESSQKIYAHSWILSMLSPVFYESFKDNFEVSKHIPVSDISYDGFLECLRFVYTSVCFLTKENVFEVLKVAQKYSLNFLQDECADFILQYVTIESVCPVLEKAITIGNHALKDKLIKFIAPFIGTILQSNSFIHLNKESLEAILNIETTAPITEVEVFKAAMKWAGQQCASDQIMVNGANKRKQLGELIKRIRFPLMNYADLGQCISQEEGILTMEEGYSLFISVSTKADNNLGFSNVERKFFVDLNAISESSIQLYAKSIGEYRSLPNASNLISQFNVNKTIYITGIRLSPLSLTQNVSIYFINNKNVVLYKEKFQVFKEKCCVWKLTKPVLINANQEYFIDVKYDNTNCNSHYNREVTVPWSKTEEGVEFSFSLLSQLLDKLAFKPI